MAVQGSAFGPSASYNVLSVLMPGLMCYAMYRCARLWVRSQTAALAAGALFGLSSMIAYQSWYLVNLPAGSDVTRLRDQVVTLDRRVRELTRALEEANRRAQSAESGEHGRSAGGAPNNVPGFANRGARLKTSAAGTSTG